MSTCATANPCASKERTTTIVPRVDIVEGQDNVIITAELPGVAKDGIELTVNDGVLTLVGKKAATAGDGYVRVAERRQGEYRRSFGLGNAIDPARIDAHMDNGVLKVTLSKTESVKPRRVSIN